MTSKSDDKIKIDSLAMHPSAAGDDDGEQEAAGISEIGGATSSRDQFSDGIMSFLEPVVAALDTQVKATRTGQLQLRQQIDTLAEDLRVISDNYQAPYDLETYVKKLQDAKKRVAVVHSILQNCQERLVKIQRCIAREAEKKKATIEGTLPPPPT